MTEEVVRLLAFVALAVVADTWWMRLLWIFVAITTAAYLVLESLDAA